MNINISKSILYDAYEFLSYEENNYDKNQLVLKRIMISRIVMNVIFKGIYNNDISYSFVRKE